MRWLTRKRRSDETLIKYYVYVSDVKVDMLFSQIPKRFLDRLAGELKIDLKILSLSLKENPSDENRFTKIRVLEQYLDASSEIGTVDDPAPYFRGSLPMKWGTVGEDPAQIVFFWGFSDQTLVGLTGSLRHVIGNAAATTSVHLGSFTRPAYEAVASHLHLSPDESSVAAENPAAWVEQAASLLKGPEEPLEFVARTLAHVSAPGTRLMEERDAPGRPEVLVGTYDYVLLGTPIYVAQGG
jgi:hypothetical protein